MENIIWKAYKLGDLFELTSSVTIALKNYTLFDNYNENRVEVVTSSKDNNNQFLNIDDLPENIPVFSNALTINRNGSIGYCFYHDDKFIIPTGDSYVLTCLNDGFKKIADEPSYHFISILITHIFTSDAFDWSYKVNDERFTREIIMLPCLEVAEGEDFIWEENGKHYTLAVEYIKKLMDKAKELREQKTIRLYEAERAKYEAGYEREKSLLVWKGFKLGELFDFSGNHIIKSQIKNLTVYDEYEPGTVGNVTASKENNGIVGYITETDEIKAKKKKHILTIASDAAYAGICYYQKDYVVSTGHNKMIDLAIPKMKELFEKEELLYLFMAKMLTKIFCKTFYGFSKSITEDDFYKNFIMLPCLEVAEGEDFIWEENGKHYTLAVEYISYIYLSGRVNKNQKLIDTYSYQY